MAAEVYERARPPYPDEALDVLQGELGLGPSSTVVELGAGTGKLSRMLARRVGLLVAAEPVESMRAQLSRAVRTPVVAAAAEAVPLASGCVDAAVAATAFHWFRGEAALAEIRRALRPGGGLGLVWNNTDRSCDWVAEIWAIVEQHRGPTPGNRDLGWQQAFHTTSGFTPLGHRRLRHRVWLSPEELVFRVASISFIAALAPIEREIVLSRVRDVAARHPRLTGRARVELPYCTDVYWCHSL
ncbi:MAG TPA: class I SAM-dependent methyltransferase [Acidimicrobiales bacterium]|nr:class I SAM-dependent methyltransferase [Acidimicrobiales bacterium]